MLAHMRWAAIVAVGLWLGCDGESAPDSDRGPNGSAQPGAPTAAPAPASRWYALPPLIESLRPALRTAPVVEGADRLPLYELDMTVEDTTFAVRETLWFTNDEAVALPELVLRIYANAVGARAAGAPAVGVDARVQLLGAHCLGEPSCRVEQVSSSTLRVVPAAPLAPGERIRVQLELGGALEAIDAARLDLLAQGVEGMSSMGGHGGGGDYGLLAMGDGVRSFANFYAVLGRRDSNGWQLEDASTLGDLGADRLGHVRMRLLLPQGLNAVASGVALGVPRDLPSGKRVQEFVAGFVRDVSVLVSDRLQVREARVGDVLVRSHFLAADQAAGERVLATACGALELFERSFGPYPYADFDLVEAPLVGGAGGVEFSGLVTLASMFYRKPGSRSGTTVPGLEAQQELFDAMLELVTAHEVAHQYWYGLVGSDSRADPFLDEGLAQFSALLYVEAAHGKERAALEAERQVAMNYRLMRTLGLADGPVLQPVVAFESPVRYAGLVYGKGPLMYRALREALGERALFAVLRQYVRDWAFRVAPRGALLATFARAGHAAKVQPLWQRWLEQAHGDEDLGAGGGLAGLFGSATGAPDSAGLQQLLSQLLGQAGEGTDQALPGAQLDLGALERQLGGLTTVRGGGRQP
jgi:hypothetical protein